MFGVEKLEYGEKKSDDTFSHFDRILACDRRMNRQTDLFQQYSSRYA